MDWIKVEKGTETKTEVIRIAEIMQVHRYEAFGMCVVFFGWADGATHDGFIPGCTPQTVNAVIRQGFAEAMQSVGWLTFDARGAFIPNFDLHNGNSAKKRAMANRRVANYRAKQPKSR